MCEEKETQSSIVIVLRMLIRACGVHTHSYPGLNIVNALKIPKVIFLRRLCSFF